MKKVLIIFLLLVAIPTSASAMDNERSIGIAGALITSVGGVMLAGHPTASFTTTSADAVREPVHIAAFLKANATNLRADIALGSGEVLSDFSKLMAIPENEIPRFEKNLRKKRKQIASFCKPEVITDASIKAFIEWVDKEHPLKPS